MLPILLMVLKILGIAILAVVGLVFAVLVLVLLVPVRYGVSGSFYGRPKGTVKVTWLLHALSVKATYEDGLEILVRVLGLRVFQKKKSASGVREELKEDFSDGAGKAMDLAEEGLGVDFVETAEDESGEFWDIDPAGRGDGHGEKGTEAAEERDDGSWGVGEEAGGDCPGNEAGEFGGTCREEMSGRSERSDVWEVGDNLEETGENRRESRDDLKGMRENRRESGDDLEETGENRRESGDDLEETGENQRESGEKEEGTAAGRGRKRRKCRRDESAKKRGGSGQRKGFKRKKSQDCPVGDQEEDQDSSRAGLVEKVKRAVESARNAWERMEEYKKKALGFWRDERNQKTMKLILRQVKAMIRHVLPRKAVGKAVFGFDDPAVTGKVLAGLGVVYAWYGDKVEIVPVFDRKVLEVEGSLKGRVQAGVLAARTVRVLLNKNFRRLLRGFLKNGGT